MKKLFLLLVLFCVGCATSPQILIEGEPAVTTSQVFKHPKTGIKAYTKFKIISEIPEGDEKLEIEDFVRPFNNNEFEVRKVKDFVVEINFLNPRKVEYIVVRTENIEYKDGGNGRYDRILYEGNLSRKKVSDSLPLYSGARVHYRIFVTDKKGEMMFKLGDIKYYVKGGR